MSDYITDRPYTPSRQNIEFLEKTTMGRHSLLGDILKSIREQNAKKRHQHWLLIGPRGIGKSHLIRIIDHRVRQDPALSQKWINVAFHEEATGIITMRDFLERWMHIVCDRFEKEGKKMKLRNGQNLFKTHTKKMMQQQTIASKHFSLTGKIAVDQI